MRVEKAFVGAKGIDCDTPLDASAARRLKAAGITFVVRYISDVKPSELDDILGADLAFMGVGHVRYTGWQPSPGMGAVDGLNIAHAARALHLPDGATFWCDVEDVADEASATDVIGYVNAWAASVSGAGGVPGLYVGFKSVLTAAQLYHALTVTRYWKSGSSVPTPVQRGFCMEQLTPLDVMFEGIKVDHDVVLGDVLGDVPTWVVA